MDIGLNDDHCCCWTERERCVCMSCCESVQVLNNTRCINSLITPGSFPTNCLFYSFCCCSFLSLSLKSQYYIIAYTHTHLIIIKRYGQLFIIQQRHLAYKQHIVNKLGNAFVTDYKQEEVLIFLILGKNFFFIFFFGYYRRVWLHASCGAPEATRPR